jgi:hypothetical protein
MKSTRHNTQYQKKKKKKEKKKKIYPYQNALIIEALEYVLIAGSVSPQPFKKLFWLSWAWWLTLVISAMGGISRRMVIL